MTTRITAEAIIKGIDETGGAFKAIQGKIDALVKKFGQVGKAAAISGQIDKLNTSLKKTQDQLAGVQKLQSAEERLSRLGARYAEQKARAEEQANARTAASAQRAAASYYKQLDAVGALRRNLEGAGLAVNQLASEEARLRGAIDGTSAAIARQNRALAQAALKEEQLAERQNRIRHGARETGRHLLGSAMGMAGGVGIGYATVRAAEGAVHQGALLQHEGVRMQAAGMTPAEIKDAEDEASKLSGKYRPFAPSDIMHLLRNARSIVGNYHEAAEVADPLMALRTVALGAHPEHAEELEADFDKLVKGMEIKGVTQDLPRFRHYIDNMAKAINVFGDTLRPTDYYQMFKYGRQSTNATSDEFMLAIAPTLAQELGGSSAGKGLENVYSHLVGGHMAQTSVQSLDKLGLIDQSKVSRTKTGAIKGVLPGGVKGTDMPGGWNFYDWMQQSYLPALTKAGITAENDIQQHIATDFGTGTATQIASIFATQQARIEKDRALQRGAEGISAADRFMTHDPLMAWESVKKQLGGAAQEGTIPAMDYLATGLDSLSSGLHHVGEFAKDHPYVAGGGALAVGGAALAGGGYMTYQFMTAGMHLNASAAALDGSAAALTEAAAVMNGKGVVPGGGAAPAGGAEAPKAGGSLWSRIWSQGLPMFGIGSLLGEEIRANPDKYPHLQPGYMPDSVRARIDGGLPGDAAFASIPPVSEYGSSFSLAEAASRRIQYVPNTSGGGFGSGLSVPHGNFDLGPKPHGDFDLGPNIRAALEGLKATVEQPVPVDVTGKVESELKGSADVRVSISVSGDGRVTSEHASSSGNIRASVSTGTSMRSLAPGSPPPDT